MKAFGLTKFVAAAALLSVLACGVAQADNFLFSFSNDPNGPGNVQGTVTGEVFGLPHNGTGAATDIQIFSYPAGLVRLAPTPRRSMCSPGRAPSARTATL